MRRKISMTKTSHFKTSRETFRFEKIDLRPHDIFFANHYSHNGTKIGHYFYCVYSQQTDESNELFRDVLALLITTKEVPGYNVEIEINGKKAYVCCDNPIRLMSSGHNAVLKPIRLTEEKQREILNCFNDFKKEATRQMKRGIRP